MKTDRLLTEREVCIIEAALSLEGLTSCKFAERAEVRYSGLRATLRRVKVPTEAEAEALVELLASVEWPTEEELRVSQDN